MFYQVTVNTKSQLLKELPTLKNIPKARKIILEEDKYFYLKLII
jgi:hypothetical protein